MITRISTPSTRPTLPGSTTTAAALITISQQMQTQSQTFNLASPPLSPPKRRIRTSTSIWSRSRLVRPSTSASIHDWLKPAVRHRKSSRHRNLALYAHRHAQRSKENRAAAPAAQKCSSSIRNHLTPERSSSIVLQNITNLRVAINI